MRSARNYIMYTREKINNLKYTNVSKHSEKEIKKYSYNNG